MNPYIISGKKVHDLGIYLNPDNEKFQMDLRSEIYVDKSNLIKYTNSVLATSQRFVCVSRPRRFGKSMAANMLTAYYSRGCDSLAIFQGLNISDSDGFSSYLNRYDVIFLNMQEFLSRTRSMDEMLSLLEKRILWELLGEYPDFRYFDDSDLSGTMQEVYQNTRIPFIFIIDEWDCIFREYKQNAAAQKQYLDFLRDLLKDKSYVHLAYMTGILPIKKYGTHSALNMFNEFSMTFAGPLAEFMGFTRQEVQQLCENWHMSFAEATHWYNGYHLKGAGDIYSPKSIVNAMQMHEFGNYWNQTENYEALKIYIDMNMDGLKDDILTMMQGAYVNINVGTFTNDMATFVTKDDVMTLLVHLGYLGYDSQKQQVFIPNHEILNEFGNAVRNSDWGEASKALQLSQEILQAIWNGDSKTVAQGIAASHLETSHLQYNDENALSYTISLALYAARNYYTIIRELPTGNGFADLIFIPRKQFPDKPALIVELKWNKNAITAIRQIKEKNYPSALKEYQGNLLLVGISYERVSRRHSCVIESYPLSRPSQSAVLPAD